jgi:hypothetical protein
MARMPARAIAFQVRYKAQNVNWIPSRMYHVTTSFRVRQAQAFLEQLQEHGVPGSPNWETDMRIFGLVNALRSGLDSFAHEIVAFYNAVVSDRRR